MARSEAPPQGVNLRANDSTDTTATSPESDQNPSVCPQPGEEGKSREVCDECGGHLITNESEVRCADCGLVHEESRIDHGPEWRGCVSRADGEQGRNVVRCNGSGRTNTVHDYGLGSEIGYTSTGTAQLSRLRTWNSRSKADTSAAQNLRYAFGEVKRVTSALGLGKQIEERACAILRSAQDHGLFKGDVIERLVGGSIYAACREVSISRLPGEIGEVLKYSDENVDGNNTVEKAVQRGYSKLCRALDLGFAPLKPVDHIPRAAGILELDRSVQVYAMRVARHIEEDSHFVGTGYAPTGVAGACIYLASDKLDAGHSQTDVGEAVGTSPKTLRDRYREITELDALPAVPGACESAQSPEREKSVEESPAEAEPQPTTQESDMETSTSVDSEAEPLTSDTPEESGTDSSSSPEQSGGQETGGFAESTGGIPDQVTAERGRRCASSEGGTEVEDEVGDKVSSWSGCGCCDSEAGDEPLIQASLSDFVVDGSPRSPGVSGPDTEKAGAFL